MKTKMATLFTIHSIIRSPWRCGFLLIPLVLACLMLSSTAEAAPSTDTSYGTQALPNKSGVNDTAFGFQALKNNTIGGCNTATGSQALLNNTEGATNTANGGLALFSNTFGQSNTASGWQSLYSNTIASEGTAIGYQALYKNLGSSIPDPTTGFLPGIQNTAVG